MKQNSSFWIIASIVFAMLASAADRQALHGHVPEAVARLNLQPIGRLPSTNRMRLAIGLPLRNKEALTNLLQQLYDPASTNYHHYLTPQQFAAKFGPADQDYQALIGFAKTNGLNVTGTYPNRTLIDVNGSVADIERAFHVTMRVYQHPTERRTFYAPDRDPSLDLEVPMLHISGFDNYVIPHPAHLKRDNLTHNASRAASAAGSGPDGQYWGWDFRLAYLGPNVALLGSGQAVGLFELAGYDPSDILKYENDAGIPFSHQAENPITLTNVLVGGGTIDIDSECALDIEMVICMAPELSKVVVYEGYSYLSGIDNNVDAILNTMANDTNNSVKQFSCSWFFNVDANAEQSFQQFITQGQSFFQASGDGDAWIGSIAAPADNPDITIVGGTTLTMNGSGTSYASETVWNSGYYTSAGISGPWPLNGNGYWGSGGGISTTTPIPIWQQGVDMSNNGGSTTMRNIPDVAMIADNIWGVYNGAAGPFVGTSFAAPLWAGFTALVNQQAAINGQASVGFLNPALYRIGKSSQASSLPPFHDIESGNNTSTGSPSKFLAVRGYDLCSGWGSPNGTNLIYALLPPMVISQPLSESVGVGNPVNFNVGVSGTAPINYQWFWNDSAHPLHDGGNVSGTLTSTLTIEDVQSTNAGSYYVVVCNPVTCVSSSNATLTVTSPTLTTNTLSVGSSNPNSGISISVAPSDATGAGSGTTPFTRGYTNAAQVTLTAPSTVGGNNFQEWQENGVKYTTALSATVTMSATYTMTAVYTSPPSATYTLTVASSNPNSGVAISASPNDNGGLAGGSTSFALTYNSNTVVYSTALATAAGDNFQTWQLDGVIYNNARSAGLTMNGNHTMTAVYGGIGIIGLSGNLSFGTVQAGAQAVREFTIQSQGGYQPLHVSGITYPPGFSGPWSGTIPIFGSTNVSVTFSPTTNGAYTGWVVVKSDATVGSNSNSISGTGVIAPPPPPVTPFPVGAFSVIYSFPYQSSLSGQWAYGVNPEAGLIQGMDGDFYGSTIYGGSYGYGVIFRVNAAGGNQLLYSFPAGDSHGGGYPVAPLMQASNGILYGTAMRAGGAGRSLGSIFSITTNGQFTTLYPFTDANDGGYFPVAPLIQATDGNLYGTASGGGSAGGGTAFKITTSGTFSELNDFDCSISWVASCPTAPLVQGKDGNFYGTACDYGANDEGNVFKMNSSGVLSNVYSFTGGNDGRHPGAGLVLSSDGNFYGIMSSGGAYGNGTVFRVTTNGMLTMLYSFTGGNDGAPAASGHYPVPPLMQATDGNLYGTTYSGGAFGDGTVFQITTNGVLTILHSFSGADGANPWAGLVQGRDGNLYGTTYQRWHGWRRHGFPFSHSTGPSFVCTDGQID